MHIPYYIQLDIEELLELESHLRLLHLVVVVGIVYPPQRVVTACHVVRPHYEVREGLGEWRHLGDEGLREAFHAP